MTKHGDACCACGSKEVVRSVDQISHCLCEDCDGALNQVVWLRIKSGVDPEGGYTGVETAFLQAVSREHWRCGAKGD